MEGIIKYPRTKHLEDSCLQSGDEGMNGYSFSDLPEDALYVYEEKVDGANCGFGFTDSAEFFCQSRGHFLSINDRNHHRERDWKLLKDYLKHYENYFFDIITNRYIVYGEWSAIVHSIFYDKLPQYFLEFDIYDKENNYFLSTEERKKLTEKLPIEPVPVLYQGKKTDLNHLKNLAFNPSLYQSEKWKDNLLIACNFVNDDYISRLDKLVDRREMEGIYIKVEKDGRVIDRFKWVNPNFKQTIINSDEHWQSRFPVPNLLNKPVIPFPEFLINKDTKDKI